MHVKTASYWIMRKLKTNSLMPHTTYRFRSHFLKNLGMSGCVCVGVGRYLCICVCDYVFQCVHAQLTDCPSVCLWDGHKDHDGDLDLKLQVVTVYRCRGWETKHCKSRMYSLPCIHFSSPTEYPTSAFYLKPTMTTQNHTPLSMIVSPVYPFLS